MKTSTALLVLVLLATSAQAEVRGVKNLIAGVLEAPGGRVTGMLTDREAEPIRIMTFSDKPVRVDAQVLARFNEDCGRVRLTFIQADALRRDGLREELRYNLDMNVCRDGEPYLPPQVTARAAISEPDVARPANAESDGVPAMSIAKQAPAPVNAKAVSGAKAQTAAKKSQPDKSSRRQPTRTNPSTSGPKAPSR